MTIEEKREFVRQYCSGRTSCDKCLLNGTGEDDDCTIGITSATEEELDTAIKRIKGEDVVDHTDWKAMCESLDAYNADLKAKLRDMENTIKSLHDELKRYETIVKTLEFIVGRKFYE